MIEQEIQSEHYTLALPPSSCRPELRSDTTRCTPACATLPDRHFLCPPNFMPHKAKTAWRRFYVFLAVSLSLFLAAISCVGIICHGFATGQFVTKQTVAPDASASHTIP